MPLRLQISSNHEMIGLRSSSKEVRLSTIGFLSNLRGEYVKPEPPAETSQGVNYDGGKDQNETGSVNNNSRSRATSRTSSLFTPP